MTFATGLPPCPSPQNGASTDPGAADGSDAGDPDGLFRLAVEACPSGMIVTDAAGSMMMLNGEAERMFGYRRDELVGQSIDVLVPVRMRGVHASLRANFRRNAAARPMGAGRDLFALRRDGSEFPVEVGLNPIKPRGVVLCVITDISARKNSERLKDEFVSVASHELRTPLTSIAGALGLLAGSAAGALPESAMRLLRIAHKNVQRLVRLINDLLDIEKIESGELVLAIKHIDVRPLVEQAIEMSRDYAHSLGVTVRLDCASAACEASADPDRLSQVIANLLSNAIKFSPPGAEVVVALTANRDMARITVRDHGPGIPEDFKPHVFQKFAQADSAKSRGKGGSGLGLSIVKGIVTRLGGSTGFADAPGGGTVFHVDLPVFVSAAE
jgi:PAS domain S-box-containing protein